jgi:hypothetical protein
MVLVWRRRRRAGRPAARAATAPPRFYARLLRALARQGLRPGPGETAREFAARAARALPGAAPVLEGVTAGYERVRFGAVTLDTRELADLEAAAESLRRSRAGRPA